MNHLQEAVNNFHVKIANLLSAVIQTIDQSKQESENVDFLQRGQSKREQPAIITHQKETTSSWLNPGAKFQKCNLMTCIDSTLLTWIPGTPDRTEL